MTDFQKPAEADDRTAKRRGRVSPLVTMVAAAILVVLTVCAAGVTVWKMHEQVDRETRANLGKLALVIADQTSRSFQSVDLVLREAASRVSSDSLNISNERPASLGGEATHQFLAEYARNLPQISNLILINSEGELVNHSRGWPASSMMLREREQFRHLRDNDDDVLFVSEPVHNLVDGAWTIYLARRINGPRRTFLGVVQAAVRLDHFAEFYRAIDLGEDSVIALVRRDGKLLVRHPAIEGSIGRALGPQSAFRNVNETIDRGGFLARGVLDGVPRYAAFGTVRGFPLVVATMVTESGALGAWRQEATSLLLGSLSAVVGVLVLLLTLVAQIRRMRRTEDLLTSQNVELKRGSRELLEAQRIGKFGHFASDEATQRTCFSQRLIEMSGMPPATSFSLDEVFALYHPEDVEGLQRARRSSIASGTTMVHEFRWIRPDGEVLWVHVEADPVLDPDGRVVGLFGIIQDVTRSKSAETVLEQRLTDLQAAQNRLEAREQELVARTADLRAARDTAETATRAKSDFLAMMSHEIRTPMTGMVGMIGLLCDTPLSNEQQRLAAIARESARDLLVVVNNILDFSKLEAGKLTAESIGFSLEHLMNGVASLLGPKAREDLPLVIIVSAGMPAWLNGDPNRIRQILLNLTSNAIKFTATGSVRLTAAHRVLTGDLVELRIEVVDSGTGISRDVQDRLFTPFTQADTSVSRKYGGTGLGLAICKQLCMTMGGSIGVESVPGQGSTFWFTVQCERAEAPIASAPPLQPTIEKMGRPLRVLVAEDNPMIGALISKLLSKRGHQSELVCNGKEALAAMQCKSYDVVLMDTQMPEMDGITATKAIRGLSGPACQVPIIALTGNALDGQRESCLAAGMNDYLSKPFEPADFYAAIDRWGAVSSKLSKQTSGP